MAEYARKQWSKLTVGSDLDAHSQWRGKPNKFKYGCVTAEMGHYRRQLSSITSEKFANEQQTYWLEQHYSREPGNAPASDPFQPDANIATAAKTDSYRVYTIYIDRAN